MAELPNVPGAGPTPPHPEPLLVDRPTAARILGMSERLLWSMTRSGAIPHLKARRRILYSVEALKNWIAENLEGGQG